MWRAKSSAGGELVALKLFPLGLDQEQVSESRQRVQREVKALGSLRLPSIVRILKHGEQEDSGLLTTGYVWVAYELVNGVDVDGALAARFPPRPSDVLALLDRLAPDLQQVHQAGLVHRDIKPGNILLREDEWASPVLVDFGYVKSLATGKLTVTGRAVGTMGYLAPEVLKEPNATSPASDLWSLGRVLAEALAVTLGADPADARQYAPLALVDELVKPKAPETASVVQSALAEDPAERPSDLIALADSVRSAMREDQLIAEAVPEGAVEHPWNRMEPLLDYFGRLGFEILDKRSRAGGCLWIVAGHDDLAATAQHLANLGVDLTFAHNGSKTTHGRPAWWTRAPR